jgi:RHS repeat-associated protein
VAVNGTLQSASTNYFLIDTQNRTGFDQVLEEMPAIGATPTASYTIGDDIIGQSTSPSGAGQYLLKDGHDSTRQLVSSLGTVTDYYGYDAYGIMLGGNPTSSSPSATKMLYTGEQFDANLGLYNLRARYYDPGVGRFTTMDSYEGSPQDPQSLHKYAYCSDNPVNYHDPSGHDTLGDVMMTILIIDIVASALSVSLSLIKNHTLASIAPDAAIFGIGLSASGYGAAAAGLSLINAVAHGGYGLPDAATGAVATIAGLVQATGSSGSVASLAGGSANLGWETLYTTSDHAISTWSYYGPGIYVSPYGGGANYLSGSLTVYDGVCWNVDGHKDYDGPFLSFSLSAGSGYLGWVVSWFCSAANPSQSGFTEGISLNFPPGGPEWILTPGVIGFSYLVYKEQSAYPGAWSGAVTGVPLAALAATPPFVLTAWSVCLAAKWWFMVK